jgi:hypothetical protein
MLDLMFASGNLGASTGARSGAGSWQTDDDDDW